MPGEEARAPTHPPIDIGPVATKKYNFLGFKAHLLQQLPLGGVLCRLTGLNDAPDHGKAIPFKAILGLSSKMRIRIGIGMMPMKLRLDDFGRFNFK